MNKLIFALCFFTAHLAAFTQVELSFTHNGETTQARYIEDGSTFILKHNHMTIKITMIEDNGSLTFNTIVCDGTNAIAEPIIITTHNEHATLTSTDPENPFTLEVIATHLEEDKQV